MKHTRALVQSFLLILFLIACMSVSYAVPVVLTGGVDDVLDPTFSGPSASVSSGQVCFVEAESNPESFIQALGSDYALVGYWPLDGNAKDNYGVVDGAISGATSSTDAMFGTAYEFDGINDEINFGDVHDEVFADDTFTISLWYKQKSSKGAMIVQKWFSSPCNVNENGFILWTRSVWGDAADGVCKTENFNEADFNEWHHLALVMSNGQALVYIDGNIVGRSSQFDAVANNRPLVLGGYASTHPQYAFPGFIDDVAILDRPLTSCEVKRLAHGEDGCKPPCGYCDSQLKWKGVPESFDSDVAWCQSQGPGWDMVSVEQNTFDYLVNKFDAQFYVKNTPSNNLLWGKCSSEATWPETHKAIAISPEEDYWCLGDIPKPNPVHTVCHNPTITCDNTPRELCNGQDDDGDGWVDIFCDDFDDGVIDTDKWTLIPNGGSITESNGYLSLDNLGSTAYPRVEHDKITPAKNIRYSVTLRHHTAGAFTSGSTFTDGCGINIFEAWQATNMAGLGPTYGMRITPTGALTTLPIDYEWHELGVETDEGNVNLFSPYRVLKGAPASLSCARPTANPKILFGYLNDDSFAPAKEWTDLQIDHVVVECKPEAETCDGWDNDCDGIVDEGCPACKVLLLKNDETDWGSYLEEATLPQTGADVEIVNLFDTTLTSEHFDGVELILVGSKWGANSGLLSGGLQVREHTTEEDQLFLNAYNSGVDFVIAVDNGYYTDAPGTWFSDANRAGRQVTDAITNEIVIDPSYIESRDKVPGGTSTPNQVTYPFLLGSYFDFSGSYNTPAYLTTSGSASCVAPYHNGCRVAYIPETAQHGYVFVSGNGNKARETYLQNLIETSCPNLNVITEACWDPLGLGLLNNAAIGDEDQDGKSDYDDQTDDFSFVGSGGLLGDEDCPVNILSVVVG